MRGRSPRSRASEFLCKTWLAVALGLLMAAVVPSPELTYAQPPPGEGAAPSPDPFSSGGVPEPEREEQMNQLLAALGRLPLAAGLACVLALRPRRRATP